MMKRRDLLAALAAFSASPAMARLGLEEDIEVFKGIARAVGGVPYIAPELLKGCEQEFVKKFGTQALFDLVALTRRSHTLKRLRARAELRVTDQLRWMANFLYTGQVGNSVPYYEHALGWQALTFATAPAQCGGPFGHWTSPEL